MANKEETHWSLKLLDKISAPMKKVKATVSGASDKVRGMNAHLGDTSSLFDQLKVAGVAAMAAIGLNSLGGTIDQIANLRNEIIMLTDVSGAQANALQRQISGMAAANNLAEHDVLIAANVLTKEMGGSLKENLSIMEEAINKGANINGDFLNQIREYPAQLSKAGMGVKDSMALIIEATKQGVFDDKAPDSIKEMTLSLSEMTKAQQDALHRIGIDSKALMADMNAGLLSPFEAMQGIIRQMDGQDIPNKQAVIADIFKGAGEDMGDQFLKFLGNANLSLDAIEDKRTAYAIAMEKTSKVISDIKSTVVDYLEPIVGGLLGFVMDNKEIFAIVTAAIGGLGVAAGIASIPTGVLTAEWWALNAAMLANPALWVVAGLAALVAFFVLAYKKSETLHKAINWLNGKLQELSNWLVSLSNNPWVQNFIQSLTDGLNNAWLFIESWAIKIWNFLLEYHPLALFIKLMDYLFPDLKKYLAQVWSWIMDNFIKPVLKVWNTIKSIFGETFASGDITHKIETDGEVEAPTSSKALDSLKKNTTAQPSKSKAKGKAAGKSGNVVGSMKIDQKLDFKINIDGSKVADKKRLIDEIMAAISNGVTDATLLAAR